MDLRGRVELFFYLLGLFLVKYPRIVIVAVTVVVIGCSLPLLSSFPTGDQHSPLIWKTSSINYLTKDAVTGKLQWIDKSQAPSVRMPIFLYAPRWFLGDPLVAVQQVIAKVRLNCTTHPKYCATRKISEAVSAATTQLLSNIRTVDKACSEFIHPITFKFLESIGLQNHSKGRQFISSVLSPSTKYKQLGAIKQEAINELLYGGYWREGGLSLSGFTGSFHIALTLILDINMKNFQSAQVCINNLNSLWSESPSHDNTDIYHVFYEDTWEYGDLFPLSFIYFIVFIYISSSVGRIKRVKSKWGVGAAAVLTVLASLTMSVGFCTYFGLNISVRGSEIFPYMIIIFGLENVLIIVKAVISTTENDAKKRVIAALKKEGVTIATNFITILILLLVGCFIFSSTMQEFCIVCMVGVLCSLFLQVVFFPAVLSIDLVRREGHFSKVEGMLPEFLDLARFFESRSDQTKSSKISKREKFVNFVASTKPIQRATVILLIAFILYYAFLGKTNVVNIHDSVSEPSSHRANNHVSQDESSLSSDGGERFFVYPVGRHNVKQRCGLRKCWYKMADSHWPDLLEQFGFPVTNGFISILNPITLRMDLGEVDKEIVSLKHVVTSYLSSLFKEPNFYGILGALTTFFLFVCVSWIHGWKVLKYPMPLRGKDKDKKRPKSAATITLKENTDIQCIAVDNGCVVSVSVDGFMRKWNPMVDNSVISINRNIPARNLSAPRPQVPGSEHGKEDTVSVTIDKAETPSIPSNPITRSPSCASLKSTFSFQSPPVQDPPQSTDGYDFRQFFDPYSQYTYKLALEHLPSRRTSVKVPLAPSVWSMDVHNGTAVLGCGNGHIETWDISSQVLLWRAVTSSSGVTTIVLSKEGIFAGRISGNIDMFNFSGERVKTLNSFQKSVSVMKCILGNLVVGSHDGVVKVYSVPQCWHMHSLREHTGDVIAMDVTCSTGLLVDCVTGCSDGLVCVWDIIEGKAVHVMEDNPEGVLKVCSSAAVVVTLAADGTIRIWDKVYGDMLSLMDIEEHCWDICLFNSEVLAVGIENALVLLNLKSGKELLHSKANRGNSNPKMITLVKNLVPLDSSHIAYMYNSFIKVLAVPAQYRKTD